MNKQMLPPKNALRFLRWFCREDYIEEIEGDLVEVYEKQQSKSPGKARWKFCWNVIRYFRPEFIKSFNFTYKTNRSAMFRHNLLITYRNFLRHKSSFFINLTGLSTGLACALLIYLWVHDELLVDKFHEKDNQLYQVMKNYADPQGIKTGEDTPGLLARVLAEEMPEVESAVSVFPPADFTFKGVITEEDNHVSAQSKFADKNFFNIFTYPLLQGQPDQVLTDPSSVVISVEMAENLFQTTENVVGKRISWKGERHSGEFQIVGIFENLPANSTIHFDILFNYDLIFTLFNGFENWGNNGPSTYIVLKENTEIDAFNRKIFDFVKLKYPEANSTLFTRPYSDRYLYGSYENGKLIGGRIEYVKLFSIIAISILLIACINFMNLSTAKANYRLKEIGVKKAIGANRKMLFSQYLSESMLLTFLASVLALILVWIALPQFNYITGKQLNLHVNNQVIPSILGITLVTGFFSGSYPAIYLSRFNPVAILKGNSFLQSKSSSGELLARKGLVVFQFVVSILLIVAVLVVFQQMQFIQSKNLGYNRENVITFTAEGKLSEAPETFLSEIKKIPGIENASYMDGDLLGLHSGTSGVEWEGKIPGNANDFEILRAGYDLIETLDIQLKAGRSFSRNFSNEGSNIILNEAAVAGMGLEDPVGKTVTVWGEEKQIIGVVRNFHYESLYENVNPFFFMFSDQARNMMVKINSGSTKLTVEQLGKFYQGFNDGVPFNYRFLDEDYQTLYASENRVAILSRYFAGFAILISCLGLFGLATFTAERRLKEIGIRKILGSSNFDIIRLLSGDFTKMVLIANVIAIPISYYISKNWLDHFAYKIDLSWWYFIGAVMVALLIAWLTVGFQTIKAARVNPVDCLKNE